MLRVQSFDIKDSEGMNNLLLEYRLAPGAHILVSDGRVCLPYEDGLPPTTAQKIVTIKEQINKYEEELWLLSHSQGVLDAEIKQIEANIESANNQLKEMEKNEDAYHEKKALRDIIEQGQNKCNQKKTQYLMNAEEINNKELNVQIFNSKIKELNA